MAILSSCKYYKITEYDSSNQKEIRHVSTNYNGRSVILHSEEDVWELRNIKKGVDSCEGDLEKVDNRLITTFESAKQRGRRGRKTNSLSGRYWDQTHLYVDTISQNEHERITLSYKDVNNAETLKYNKLLNFGSSLGFTVAGLGVGIGVLALLTCNCPHAYTFDGHAFHYTNTLFTGATAKNLERNDFKILPDYSPDSDSYEMIIKNEENESHYTNLIELLVVNHDANVEVVSDQNGTIHSLSKLETAKNIVDQNGVDLSNELSFRDDVAYSFDHVSEENMINTFASFTKPENVSNAKLVLKLKNTEWAAVVYKSFASMMGDKYEGWVEKNHARTPEEANAGMKSAGVPMIVSIKKGDEWIDIETVSLVGEPNYNTLAFPIDQSLISGENIEIRLQAGFKFWNLDYVAMDFSQDANLETETIKPSIADGSSHYISALSKDDDLYMEHAVSGDSTYLKFEGLKSTGEKRTIILRSKGYYISNEEYAGTPYWKELMKLRAPGGLSRLSQELFVEYSKYAALKTGQ